LKEVIIYNYTPLLTTPRPCMGANGRWPKGKAIEVGVERG